MSPSVSARLLLTQSDTRLVELARAGHERAFEALVQRYRRPLLGYCRRLLLPAERAEDALQQGLLQAWLALRAGAEVREVKPWLYRIVHNAALNMLRRSGYNYAELHESLSGVSADAPAEDLDRRIAVRQTLAGLAALPELQREALLRTAVHGRSYEEAAATLGLSESSLRGLVHRARCTLRAATTALTPTPLLSWALSAGGVDGSLTGRAVELGASGGSVGLVGALVKAGAAVVTAGVLVGGASAARHVHHTNGRHHLPTAVAARGVGRSSIVAGSTRELAFSTVRPPTGLGSTASDTIPHRSPVLGSHHRGDRGNTRGRHLRRSRRRHLEPVDGLVPFPARPAGGGPGPGRSAGGDDRHGGRDGHDRHDGRSGALGAGSGEGGSGGMDSHRGGLTDTSSPSASKDGPDSSRNSGSGSGGGGGDGPDSTSTASHDQRTSGDSGEDGGQGTGAGGGPTTGSSSFTGGPGTSGNAGSGGSGGAGG